VHSLLVFQIDNILSLEGKQLSYWQSTEADLQPVKLPPETTSFQIIFFHQNLKKTVNAPF
jgi:hypothetical protein